LPSLAWSHRKSPLHQPEREESRLAIRGNPQNRICKKIALQRPKTGKFDYLSEPNHPAHSMAFKFFTDDKVLGADEGTDPKGLGGLHQGKHPARGQCSSRHVRGTTSQHWQQRLLSAAPVSSYSIH